MIQSCITEKRYEPGIKLCPSWIKPSTPSAHPKQVVPAFSLLLTVSASLGRAMTSYEHIKLHRTGKKPQTLFVSTTALPSNRRAVLNSSLTRNGG